MKPIIFSAPMVRKILDGEKRQTRRVLHEANFAPRGRPPIWAEAVCPARDSGYIAWQRGIINDLAAFTKEQYARGFEPRYNVGDRLWVREPWRVYGEFQDGTAYCYQADNEYSGKWKNSMYMPRNAARLFPEVIAVRPERLLDITESDAQAEGFNSRDEYLAYWNTLYAKKPQLQAKHNPWTWVYGFSAI